MNHYNLHRQDDGVLDLGPNLALRHDSGTIELIRSEDSLAEITIQPGEKLGADPAFAQGILLSGVTHADSVSTSELALALYCSLQKARVRERTTVVANLGISDRVGELVGLSPLAGCELLGARVDIALRDLAKRFEGSIEVPPALYLHEVTATVNSHVRRSFAEPGSFFAAVGQGQVSEQQYVYLMSQQHAYVRYTTRILGYCVAYSEHSAMRQHFAKHLSEEVNHEKIIEADLRYLGADVDYVIQDLEPTVSAAQFGLGELALVSHFHDPVLLMAAPLVAEGMTAHLDRAFITALNKIVRSWGYDTPARATHFISSHIDFDGGDDGHFEGSMQALEPYVTNERSLRRFLSALHAQANSFLRIYVDAMTESACSVEASGKWQPDALPRECCQGSVTAVLQQLSIVGLGGAHANNEHNLFGLWHALGQTQGL